MVIEAKEKSGSLITANFALKQNKKLFAVPGQIYSKNSEGPHKLIKEGAKMITSARDILDELGVKIKQIPENNTEPEDNEERAIINALRDEPLNIDKIIEKTKLSAQVVATSLALMEISGKIRSLRANTYSLN